MAVVLGRFTVDLACGCCGETGLVWGCESLTGTAELCGISAYSADLTPYNPLDPDTWEGQFRKWLNRDLDGLLKWRSGDCSSCPDGLTGDGGGDYNFSGTFSVTCDDTAYGILNGINYTEENCAVAGPFSFAIDSLYTAAFNVVPLACPVDGVGGYSTPVKDEHTLLSRTVTACGCYTSDFSIYFETLGLATEELREEVYLYNALEAAGDAVAGTSCCTELTESDRTEPESIAPMTMTGTAVKVSITVTGGDPDTDYVVNVTMEQANDFPEPPTIINVALSIPGSTTSAYYPPLPIPGDYPICVVSVELST